MLNQNYIRVLYIDLTKEKIKIEKREDLTKYLGGVGIASKLLEENLKPELPPLDENQPVVFAIGCLSTIYPVITKTVAMFVSPLTGELGESYSGGRLALCMFNAGYDAIVITGKAKRPSYLAIESNNVEFNDARALWGLNSDDLGQYIRDNEPGGGNRSILRIGVAGENLCSYASVCVDTYRHFGRLGLGAVLGSKHLKAMMVTGNDSSPIDNFPLYFKTYQEIYKKVTDTELMAKYHDAGTPINVVPLSEMGGLPSYNLKETRFENAENISGETFAQKNLIRKLACTGCPVGCIHIGQLRRQFDHGYEYENVRVGYDYELIYALGSNLGIDESDKILELIEAVETDGLDAMSAGVCLGWATEALEKGLVSLDDTIVELSFGDAKSYIQAIHYISKGINPFYQALAKGVAYASIKYGGYDFGIQIAKNEIPGYHTGYGSVAGYMFGARHSHLCNGGYSYDQKLNKFDEDKIVDYLFNEEVERCLLNSLTICLFARKVYDRETILKAFHGLGMEYTNEQLDEAAKEIYKTKLRIKKAFKFKLEDIKIPKRFFETKALDVELNEETVKGIISKLNEKNEELLNS